MRECFVFCGDEVLLSSHSCPHRLDFRRPTPSNFLPPGVRLVEAHSLQSERRPTPSSLPRNVYSGPELRATPFSISTVYISLCSRFCFLDTPGPHGAKILTEQVVVILISREARGG